MVSGLSEILEAPDALDPSSMSNAGEGGCFAWRSEVTQSLLTFIDDKEEGGENDLAVKRSQRSQAV
jgi:hypothetical protein